MVCRQCGAQMPDGTRLCPECGAPQLKPLAPERRRRLRWILIAVAALVVIAGAVLGFLAVEDRDANAAVKEAICDFRFNDAEVYAKDVRLFRAKDEDVRQAIIRVGKLLDAKQYVHAISTVAELRAQYDAETLSPFRGVLDKIEATAEPLLYQDAQDAYNRGDYQTAFGGFDVLAQRGYADCGNWLFLTQAHLCEDLTKLSKETGLTEDEAAQKLLSLIGFSDTNKLLMRVDSYAMPYFTGRWTCGDGDLTVTARKVTCTLPGITEEDACALRGGAVYVGETEAESVAFYTFSILNARTMIADSTADGRVYTMRREG
ncbi:MAG: zinc ribbon domain-containing protein [Oscillospiraceae bacterium]|nr:zinc ribbon domain-containing protein [Oscillospiraceae bacterium]